jgi:hypothetical protein
VLSTALLFFGLAFAAQTYRLAQAMIQDNAQLCPQLAPATLPKTEGIVFGLRSRRAVTMAKDRVYAVISL